MINRNQLVSIPSEKDSLMDALGISEKRRDEILKHLDDIEENVNTKRFSDELEFATSISQNINETGYICFIIGAKSGSDKAFKRILDKAEVVEFGLPEELFKELYKLFGKK